MSVHVVKKYGHMAFRRDLRALVSALLPHRHPGRVSVGPSFWSKSYDYVSSSKRV